MEQSPQKRAVHGARLRQPPVIKRYEAGRDREKQWKFRNSPSVHVHSKYTIRIKRGRGRGRGPGVRPWSPPSPSGRRPQWRRLHSPRAPINHGGPRQASHELTNNETMGEIKHGDITLFTPYNCWRACPTLPRLMEPTDTTSSSSSAIFSARTAIITPISTRRQKTREPRKTPLSTVDTQLRSRIFVVSCELLTILSFFIMFQTLDIIIAIETLFTALRNNSGEERPNQSGRLLGQGTQDPTEALPTTVPYHPPVSCGLSTILFYFIMFQTLALIIAIEALVTALRKNSGEERPNQSRTLRGQGTQDTREALSTVNTQLLSHIILFNHLL